MKRSFAGFTGALVSLIGLIARPQTADACSYPADSITVRDTPVGGLVVIDTVCVFGDCFEGELPTELTVIDTTDGVMVPGEIAHTAGSIDNGAMIAWRPTAPLIEGHTYEVLWQPETAQSFAELDLEFSALPSVTWSPEDIRVEASVEVLEEATETIRCDTVNYIDCGSASPGDIDPRQIATNVTQQVALIVAIDTIHAPDHAYGNYLVTMALWGDGEAQPEQVAMNDFTYGSIGGSKVFEHALDSYCYRVEITSLLDESSMAVTEDCIAHDLGELTSAPVGDERIASQLGSCVSAPEGYLDLWCGSRAAYCEELDTSSGMMEQGCDTLEDACAEMEPDDVGEGDDDSGMSPEPGLNGGCSATQAGGPDGAGSWIVLLVGALWVRKTARKRGSTMWSSL